MHVISNSDLAKTLCGLDIGGWSRAYTSQPIAQILCKKCNAAMPIRPSLNGRGYEAPTYERAAFVVGA